LAFTQDEFDIMVDELLYRKPISFDMLCHIAEKTLKKKISSWCYMDEDLRGRQFEDDIMQEVNIRLMKTTINRFLLINGVGGPVNNDAQGFKSWMETVAVNIKKDFVRKVRNVDFNTDNLDNPKLEKNLVYDDSREDEKKERLRKAFSTVLSADVSVYKVFTWIAQCIFVVDYDITKIQSNQKIIEVFEQKTLFEMYDIIKKLAYRIEWMEISTEQNRRIINALNKKWNNDLVYGDVIYKEFFMKVKGQKSGKKSISDWVNRMNDMIRKKNGEKNKKNIRRDMDGSSDH